MNRLVFEKGYAPNSIGFVFYASISNRRISCIVGREDIADTHRLSGGRIEERYFDLNSAHVAAQKVYDEHGVGANDVLIVSMFEE